MILNDVKEGCISSHFMSGNHPKQTPLTQDSARPHFCMSPFLHASALEHSIAAAVHCCCCPPPAATYLICRTAAAAMLQCAVGWDRQVQMGYPAGGAEHLGVGACSHDGLGMPQRLPKHTPDLKANTGGHGEPTRNLDDDVMRDCHEGRQVRIKRYTPTQVPNNKGWGGAVLPARGSSPIKEIRGIGGREGGEDLWPEHEAAEGAEAANTSGETGVHGWPGRHTLSRAANQYLIRVSPSLLNTKSSTMNAL